MNCIQDHPVIPNNISLVVKFQRWWVQKSRIFDQESLTKNKKKEIQKVLMMNDSSTKSAKIVLSKSIFYVKNQQN